MICKYSIRFIQVVLYVLSYPRKNNSKILCCSILSIYRSIYTQNSVKLFGATFFLEKGSIKNNSNERYGYNIWQYL